MPRKSNKPRRARKAHYRTVSGKPEMAEVTLNVPRDRIGMVKKYAKRISRMRPANRDEVLFHLRRHGRLLAERFGVASMAVFGSVARGESKRESDVDLLVEFAPGRPDGMLEFVELKGWLESILGRPVDLVTPANIKPRIKERILKEAVHVL